MTDSTSLTILSTAIKQDAEGRYCLNDCHRASGAEKKDGPSYWLATKDAEKLVEKLNEETAGMSVVTVEGRNGGTFVAKELVYAYAMWISADFSLTVIRAFDRLMGGEIPSARPKRIRKPSVLQTFKTGYGIAKIRGLDDNQASLCAARYCHTKCGENPLELMGATSIAAPKAENYLTPTQIGEEIGMNARAVNVALIQQGYQVKVPSSAVGSDYEPTEKGKDVSRFFDTTRRHGKGSQQQLKWSPRMVAILRPFAKKPEPAS